jgi:hypothetical protein
VFLGLPAPEPLCDDERNDGYAFASQAPLPMATAAPVQAKPSATAAAPLCGKPMTRRPVWQASRTDQGWTALDQPFANGR